MERSLDEYHWLRERLCLLGLDPFDVTLFERVLYPSQDRLSCTSKERSEILRRHELALREGKKTYVDPKTSFYVFTALSHLERGYCCENSCRHCPYSDGERLA